MTIISKQRFRRLFLTPKMRWFAISLAALSAASIAAVLAATFYRGQVEERAEAWAPVEAAEKRVLELEATVSVAREFNEKDQQTLRQPDSYFAGFASHYFGTVRADAEKRRQEMRQEMARRRDEARASQQALVEARRSAANAKRIAQQVGAKPADGELQRADRISRDLFGKVLLGHMVGIIVLLFGGFLYYRHG